MRLLQLDPHGSEGAALDLHPLITVVSGANDTARQRIVRAVSALSTGDDPGIGGHVEVFGVRLDLTVDVLALLDLHGDLDVVVRAADVPTLPRQPGRPARSTTTRRSSELSADQRRALESGIAELQESLDHVDRAIDAVATIDTRPIWLLLDAIREPGAPDRVESERTQARAELTAVQTKMAALGAHLEAILFEARELRGYELDAEASATTGPSGPDAIGSYLRGRATAQLNRSFAGSIPLLLDDALAGARSDVVGEVFAPLEAVADAVQVIWLTDDPTVHDRALAAGPEVAKVVRTPRDFL